MNATEAITHAQTLREQARAHKRAEAENRRKARLKMAELRRFCEAHGITLNVMTIDRDQEVRVHEHHRTS